MTRVGHKTADGKGSVPAGLLIGLEIHQQLDTDKLFCRCPSTLDDGEGIQVSRSLRPTQSEMGEVDRAAVEEAKKRLAFEYIAPPAVSCLVELDEEPPHPVSETALQVGLEVAADLSSSPVDELQVMRKIVIDGSNTTGFQRTALLALGGRVETTRGPVGIQTICLEEDSARRLGRKGDVVTFRLDRLGIPLLEIATAPDIKDGDHARETAEALGRTLRKTGKAKRGIGTIRQDVNISIPGGARVELKGVQELRTLPGAVDSEIARQEMLIRVAAELKRRGANTSDLSAPIRDVSSVFKASASKVVTDALSAGGSVHALALPRFEELLGKKGQPGFRLGAELAGRARARSGVAGLFHSDELPAYGITEEEVEAIRSLLGLRGEDAFAIVAASPRQCTAALEAARERAMQAMEGVPEETREIRPDLSSHYLRPLPGRARMYPETDIPPRRVTPEDLAAADRRRTARENAARELEAFVAGMVAPGDLVQLQNTGNVERFAKVAGQLGVGGAATKERGALLARILLHTVPEVEAASQEGRRVGDALLAEVIAGVEAGLFPKDAVLPVLIEVTKTGGSVGATASRLGLSTVGEEEVRRVVAAVVQRNAKLVKDRGEAALGPLMGDCMKELRGKVDGRVLGRLLAEEIRRSAAK
ncbi:MAG: Glu-tRNA(Gln) amidotransferase subunit GatE [Euryarchaeota archaeon]|nr:Glu-tRNA(Gln) amidotransferase subunit GatE [Euryarchaeota archaeon]